MYLRMLAVFTVCWLVSSGIGSAVPVAGSFGPGMDPEGWTPDAEGIYHIIPPAAEVGPTFDPQGWCFGGAGLANRTGTLIARVGPTADPCG